MLIIDQSKVQIFIFIPYYIFCYFTQLFDCISIFRLDISYSKTVLDSLKNKFLIIFRRRRKIQEYHGNIYFKLKNTLKQKNGGYLKNDHKFKSQFFVLFLKRRTSSFFMFLSCFKSMFKFEIR